MGTYDQSENKAPENMNEDEQYIYESIVSQVRMGFNDPEDIKIMIQEQVEDEEFDISESWVSDHVDHEYKVLASERKQWTHPTDTEKLALAFDELIHEHKFITLHHAGYTTSDGESDVVEIEIALREKGIMSEGYCFYHEQDLARALSSGILGIAYQKINNEDPSVTLSIGKTIAQKLRQHSFQIKWDNDVNTKIEIGNFSWQKIYNADEYSMYDDKRVIRILTK